MLRRHSYLRGKSSGSYRRPQLLRRLYTVFKVLARPNLPRYACPARGILKVPLIRETSCADLPDAIVFSIREGHLAFFISATPIDSQVDKDSLESDKRALIIANLIKIRNDREIIIFAISFYISFYILN